MFNICTQYFMKLTSFKNIFSCFTGILLLAIFLISSSHPQNITEAVLTLNNLTSSNYISIEKDFSKMRSVKYCEVSLITSTVTLQINDRIISQNDIDNTLRKWGCSILKSSFVKLAGLLTH